MKTYACRPDQRTRFQTRMTPQGIHPFAQMPVSREMKSTRPAANIIRLENGYHIQLAIPGVPKDQIKIDMIEGQLAVSTTNPNQETKTSFVRHEFDYTTAKRIFKLHRNANIENLVASFDQGILTIVIPDKEPETRKIEIQ